MAVNCLVRRWRLSPAAIRRARASRRKYSISKGDAAKLIAEEEATIIRSAEEKAIIEGKGKNKDGTTAGEFVDTESSNKTVEKPKVKASQEAEPMI